MTTIQRTPIERPAGRMEPLSRLPVFFALQGRCAVVAGGSAAAAWKAELLSASGATVEVYAKSFSEEMIALAKQPPLGQIRLHRKPWDEADLAGAAMAVGAFEGDQEAGDFAKAARAAGVPVNVVDRPAFCDFSFGAIVNRSPLVIGISTDGAAPVFGQAVRAKLEALLPHGFAAWAKAAQSWRTTLKQRNLPAVLRRRFWELFARQAMQNPGMHPTQTQFDTFVESAQGNNIDASSVSLVGAGPGDPELLTLRAVRTLQSADVILFDDLVAPAILDFARREAKKMLVGKTGRGPSCKQDDINRLMVSLAKAGKRVVRLKGGDPMIFGRAGEEIAACEAAGLAVEVVPGITAAQGAASRLKTSLTHRHHAQRVQFVTGHAKHGTLPDTIDWQSLADPNATTAVYMPAGTLTSLAAKAVAEGIDPHTPAVAVTRATRPDETVIGGTIADIADRIAAAAPSGPLLVLFGTVFADAARRTRPTSCPAVPAAGAQNPRAAPGRSAAS
jgi:uroporphyrin-III C-methyltransferase/precorrin-2 dehydrogenase/sirohydrochlorin ferrochelatase